MRSETTKHVFAPVMLKIETIFEFECVSLALRMGADAMRAIGNDDAAACAEFARECLNNPEVQK